MNLRALWASARRWYETHSVREFCETAFASAGMPLTWTGSGLDEQAMDAQGQVRVQVDPRYFRPAEVDVMLGDASKARRELDWKPTVTFQQLVEMMVRADLEAMARDSERGE